MSAEFCHSQLIPLFTTIVLQPTILTVIRFYYLRHSKQLKRPNNTITNDKSPNKMPNNS